MYMYMYIDLYMFLCIYRYTLRRPQAASVAGLEPHRLRQPAAGPPETAPGPSHPLKGAVARGAIHTYVCVYMYSGINMHTSIYIYI